MTSTTRRTGAIAALLFSTVTLASAQASAQSEKVAAEALFRDARKLLDAGQYKEACDKLAASQRLDPAVGTLLNLARCYEKVGRTATAWATYQEAAAAAQASRQPDRMKSARKAADALEPELPRLTITVPPDTTAELQLTRNGVAVPKELWGETVPVDPGEHVLEARATGRKPWSTKVTLEPKATQTISVPELAAVEPEPAAAPSASESSVLVPTDAGMQADAHARGSWSTQKTLAVVAAGVGVAGVTVAVIHGLKFQSKRDEADDLSARLCPGGSCPDEAAKRRVDEPRDEAENARNIGIVSAAAGGAFLVAGAVLWFTAPSVSKSATSWQVTPVAGLNDWGIRAHASW